MQDIYTYTPITPNYPPEFLNILVSSLDPNTGLTSLNYLDRILIELTTNIRDEDAMKCITEIKSKLKELKYLMRALQNNSKNYTWDDTSTDKIIFCNDKMNNGLQFFSEIVETLRSSVDELASFAFEYNCYNIWTELFEGVVFFYLKTILMTFQIRGTKKKFKVKRKGFGIQEQGSPRILIPFHAENEMNGSQANGLFKFTDYKRTRPPKKKENIEKDSNNPSNVIKFTEEIKLEAVILAIQLGNNCMAARKIGEKYNGNLSESTIRIWTKKLYEHPNVQEELKKQEELELMRSPDEVHVPIRKNVRIEEELQILEWINKQKELGEMVNIEQVLHKALEFIPDPDFRASNGYFSKFRKRHGLKVKNGYIL